MTDRNKRRNFPSNVWLRRALFFSGALVTGGITVYAVADRLFSAPRYEGPVSDHFGDGKFYNPGPQDQHGFADFLRWRLTGNPGVWRRWMDARPRAAPPERVGDGRLRVTFIGHATTLIQMDGLNILTDPVWSERASPVAWAGPKRVRPPGLRFEDLPQIDAVLISHNHYDHLDVPTLRRLAEAHRPRYIVALGNRALLESKGVRGVVELDWWQGFQPADDLQIVCVPAKHFSGRGLSDRDRTLWCGYVIQGSSGTTYFAGDTAMGPHFGEIRDRYGPIRLALLPIGAFLPRWFMAPVHVSPEEAVEAHQILDAGTSVAIHFGTFALGDDGEREAVEELYRALENAGEQRERFWVLDFGEGRDVPPVERRASESWHELKSRR